jgi:hypothetical protein
MDSDELAQWKLVNPEMWALWQLPIACQEGDLERVKSLFRPLPPSTKEARISEREMQDIGFCLAAANGHCHIVRFFLDQGNEIPPDAPVAATRSRSTAIFQIFLDHGWDINSLKHDGYPVLE